MRKYQRTEEQLFSITSREVSFCDYISLKSYQVCEKRANHSKALLVKGRQWKQNF
jgi:hypothetical protein